MDPFILSWDDPSGPPPKKGFFDGSTGSFQTIPLAVSVLGTMATEGWSVTDVFELWKHLRHAYNALVDATGVDDYRAKVLAGTVVNAELWSQSSQAGVSGTPESVGPVGPARDLPHQECQSQLVPPPTSQHESNPSSLPPVELAPSVSDVGAVAGSPGDGNALEFRSDRVRKARTNLGLSQAEFAVQIGISVVSLSLLENGHTEPKIGTCLRLSDATGKPVEWFWKRLA